MEQLWSKLLSLAHFAAVAAEACSLIFAADVYRFSTILTDRREFSVNLVRVTKSNTLCQHQWCFPGTWCKETKPYWRPGNSCSALQRNMQEKTGVMGITCLPEMMSGHWHPHCRARTASRMLTIRERRLLHPKLHTATLIYSVLLYAIALSQLESGKFEFANTLFTVTRYSYNSVFEIQPYEDKLRTTSTKIIDIGTLCALHVSRSPRTGTHTASERRSFRKSSVNGCLYRGVHNSQVCTIVGRMRSCST